jgi:hypothetical protein
MDYGLDNHLISYEQLVQNQDAATAIAKLER